jgi:uncharacterized protein (DUF1015 family)
MPLIKPFAGLRPVPERAEEVVAPPYDVLNSAEARERAAGRPWSFLHISKAEIDLAEDIDPYDPAVYAKSAENLQKMLDEGILIRDEKPCYYVYRLIMDGHSQVGLVAAASVADYDTNRVRKYYWLISRKLIWMPFWKKRLNKPHWSTKRRMMVYSILSG